VKFEKQQVLDFLIEQGKSHLVPEAEQELPAKVDTEEHAGLLAKFGIDPAQLLEKFGLDPASVLDKVTGGSGAVGKLLG